VEIKCQLDVAEVFIADLIACSTSRQIHTLYGFVQYLRQPRWYFPLSYYGGLLPNPSPVILSSDVIYFELQRESKCLGSSVSVVTELQATISRKHDPPPANSQRICLSSRALWPSQGNIQAVIQSVLLRLPPSAGKTA